ncbi:centromere protein S isoform X1 [Myotis daubentonii]|uniref:centromere protein S isoform X1 n=1 Tax=Myotis daubentonii TaxID=98922 RepID=UPI002873BE97|nr:centromere protein S isoform X1 [Myotis daubentonii]
MEAEKEGAEEQQGLFYRQRLKAAVHYTVGCLCEEVASDKEVQLSRQTIAAISEVTFRQCESFAKDLEMFARLLPREPLTSLRGSGRLGDICPRSLLHAKRSTINTEDVKLLARRSNSLLKYITEKSEEITKFNVERKTKKKKKLEDENKDSLEPAEAGGVGSEN